MPKHTKESRALWRVCAFYDALARNQPIVINKRARAGVLACSADCSGIIGVDDEHTTRRI